MKRGDLKAGRTARIFGLCCVILCLTAGCAERTAYRYLDMAHDYEQRGDGEPALMAFRAAVEACPGDVYLRRALGRAYSRRKMYAEAAGELEQVLQAEPDYVEVYLDMAAIFEAQHMPEAAIGWLERAVQTVPDYLPANRDLAEFYLSREQPDEALALLERMAKRWPEAAWVHYSLGQLYLQLNLNSQAEAAFRSAVGADGGFAQAYASLGNALYEQKKHGAAVEAYQTAISLNPRDHSSLNNLAWVYAVQGIQLQEGIEISSRALQLAPDSPIYLDTLAELYYRQGDSERAVTLIRRAIVLYARHPEDPELEAHLQHQLKKFTAAGSGKV